MNRLPHVPEWKRVTLLLLCLVSCKGSQDALPGDPPVARVLFPSDRRASTGMTIVISGENLANNAADNQVKIGGVVTSFTELVPEYANVKASGKAKLLMTCVPAAATSGEIALTVGKHTVELGGLIIRNYKATGNWKQLRDYPGMGSGVNQQGFVLDGKIFTAFGTNPSTNLPCLVVFDPANGKWERKADFPGGFRTGFVTFTAGGKGYVGLGLRTAPGTTLTDGLEKDIWEYDPGKDRWSKKADFPGNRRASGYAMSIGEKGYVGGGMDVSIKVVNDFWEYDAAKDSWKKKAKFPYEQAFSYGLNMETPITFASADYGYFISGELADASGLKWACWQYAPKEDKWIVLPEIPAKGGWGFWSDLFAFGYALGSKVYVGTPAYDGAKGDKTENFFAWDEATRQWTRLHDFPGTPLRSPSWVVGDKAYVGLSLYHSDLWEFIP